MVNLYCKICLSLLRASKISGQKYIKKSNGYLNICYLLIIIRNVKKSPPLIDRVKSLLTKDS